MIHPRPDGGDEPFFPHAEERGERLCDRFVEVVVGIVQQRDIDAVEAEPLEAGFERAPDAVRAQIEYRVVIESVAVGVVFDRAAFSRNQNPPDFRRQDEVVSWVLRQDTAEAHFGFAGP